MWDHYSSVQKETRLERLNELSHANPPDLVAMYVLGIWEWREGRRSDAEALLLKVSTLAPTLGREVVFKLPDFVQATTADDPSYDELGYQADPEVLADFALDEGEWQTHYALAAHPLTPETAIKALIENAVENEGIAVGSNFGLSDSFYSWYVTEARESSTTLGVSALMTLAKNPAIPLGVMETLMSSEDPGIRESLAGNYSVPQELLTRLALDPDQSVREAALRNPFHSETFSDQNPRKLQS